MKVRPGAIVYGITLIAIALACTFLFTKNSGLSLKNGALRERNRFLDLQLSTERGLLLGTIRDMSQGKDLLLQKQAYLSTYANIPGSFPSNFPPNLIFTGKTASWSSLAKYLPDFVDGTTISPKIITSFSSAFPSAPHPLPTLTPDGKIHFPEYGEYYLRTSAGNFKILVLDPEAGDDSNILSIAAFVSRNIVHSNANHPSADDPEGYDALIGRLFLSDSPLNLWCFQGTGVLNRILSRWGYSTRHVHLKTAQGLDHHVSEVYFPEAGKWGMIDDDFSVYIVDAKTAVSLNTAEIASRLANNPESIKLHFLTRKRLLKSEFNMNTFTPLFTWTPDNLMNKPITTTKDYTLLMKNYTYDINVISTLNGTK